MVGGTTVMGYSSRSSLKREPPMPNLCTGGAGFLGRRKVGVFAFVEVAELRLRLSMVGLCESMVVLVWGKEVSKTSQGIISKGFYSKETKLRPKAVLHAVALRREV